MSPDFDYQWLDEALRNIPVPESVAARLQEIGTCSDSDLDAALRGSPPRAILRDRLLAVGTLSDQDLADELRDVRVPGQLLARCREIPRTEPVTGLPLLRRVSWLEARPWLQYTVAASLMLFLGRLEYPAIRDSYSNSATATCRGDSNAGKKLGHRCSRFQELLAASDAGDARPKARSRKSLLRQIWQPDRCHKKIYLFLIPRLPKARIVRSMIAICSARIPGLKPLPDLVSVGEPENRGLRPAECAGVRFAVPVTAWRSSVCLAVGACRFGQGSSSARHHHRIIPARLGKGSPT